MRLRFTVLYAVMFLLSGVGLLALTNLLANSSSSQPAPGQVPSGQLRIQQLEAQLADSEAIQSRQLLVGSVIALVVMAVVSVLLGRAIAGRVLRPLEASFTAQRRFVANASHELRTPLTTMRASLDVAMAKPNPPPQTVALADRIRTELDQVDQLLEGLLVLARAQHGVLADNARVSLRDMAIKALAARADDITGKGLMLDTRGLRDTAPVHGSPTLLARMVENVIDNAIVHNQDGGWIRLASDNEHGSAVLVVETGGNVLDQEHVEKLAQPFQRLVADRTGSERGSGLGLSIVAAITETHGGRLRLQARPEGGLRVVITLPGAQS